MIQTEGQDDGLSAEKRETLLFEELAKAHREITNLHKKLNEVIDEFNSVVNEFNSSKDPKSVTMRIDRGERLKETVREYREKKLNTRMALRKGASVLVKNPPVTIDFKLESQPKTTKHQQASSLAGENAITNALESGDLDAAYIWGRAIRNDHMSNQRFVELLEKIAVQRGNISANVSLARKKVDSGWVSASALEVVQGRFKDLVCTPHLVERFIPQAERNKNLVVHLVKESIPYHSNGFCARSFANLRAESNAGYEVVSISEPGFPGAASWNGNLSDTVEGIEHIRLLPEADSMTSKMPLSDFNQLFAELALQKVIELRPSVIHASSGRRGYETGKVAMAVSKATGIPLVYEIRSFFEGTWTSNIDVEEQGEIFGLRKAAELELANYASQVVTICESMRKELVEWGVDPNKIEVAPNGINTSIFYPDQKSDRLLEYLGLSLDDRVVGYVSNFDHPRESQETIVEAIAELKKVGINVKGLLVGSGNRSKDIIDLAIRLGVNDRIVLTGSIPHSEVAEYYRLIDIFVVPRRNERAARLVTPLKPFEAMACRIPVVVSDLPALVEIVSPPERGLSFEERNAKALAKQIKLLFNDDDLRTNLAEAGYEWTVQNRKWSDNGAIYRRVFNKAIGDH